MNTLSGVIKIALFYQKKRKVVVVAIGVYFVDFFELFNLAGLHLNLG